MKECEFTDDDGICTANGWLGDQDQEFFYSGIWALKNCWTKVISVERDYVEKSQTIMLIFCC